MLKKSSRQYLVLTSNIQSIYNKLAELEPTPIMVNLLIKRVVCKQPKNKEDKEPEENNWLRVLEGDIEYIGDIQRCTMTYIIEKDKEKDKEKDNLVLKVDNFEDAIYLAEKMGYSEKSYQENLRSKFMCQHGQGTYIIRFDVWAQIPKFTVIQVELLSGQNDNNDIVKYLEINEYAGEIDGRKFKKGTTKTLVDVDELYEAHTNIKASELSYITFKLGLWKNGVEKKVKCSNFLEIK